MIRIVAPLIAALVASGCQAIAYKSATLELPFELVQTAPELKQLVSGGFQPQAFVVAGRESEVAALAEINKELLKTFGEYKQGKSSALPMIQLQAEQFVSRFKEADAKNKVKVEADMGFVGPPGFGDPGFAAAFYTAFDVRSITIGVERFHLKYPDEDLMEPYFHIGYQTTTKTFMDLSGTPYEDVRNETIIFADKSRFVQLDGKEDLTLLLRFYEEDGEFLRTETKRFLSEFEQQAQAGLVLQTSSERLSSLQLGVLDWVPVVNWIIQFGMWGWSWFSRTDDLTPTWKIPLVRERLFTPSRDEGNLIKSMVVKNAVGQEVAIPNNANVAQIILAMQLGVRLIVTIESIHARANATYTIDLYYFKK